MGVVLGVWLAAPENSRGAAVRDYLRAVGLWALVAREHKDRAP
jgi:hypothetical protein